MRYLYAMSAFNRKGLISAHCEDLMKMGLVDLDDLSNSAAKFKQRRKKLTSVQKLYFDQLELNYAMKDLYEGLYKFSVACSVKGIIKALPADNSL